MSDQSRGSGETWNFFANPPIDVDLCTLVLFQLRPLTIPPGSPADPSAYKSLPCRFLQPGSAFNVHIRFHPGPEAFGPHFKARALQAGYLALVMRFAESMQRAHKINI